MSIVRYLTDRVWAGDIYFLVIAKTERDIIFHDELQWLKARFPRLHICITLTRAEPESMWQGDRGRANAALLKRFVPNLTEVPAYLCGPNEMMDSTRELLLSVGIPRDQIKTEAFVSPAGSAENKEVPSDLSSGNGKLVTARESTSATSTNQAGTLTFARSNVDAEVDNSQSILEAAEEAGVEIPFECRSGICGQCKSKLLKGSVSMDSEDALSPAEKANGFILACQAHLRSDVIIDA
jgi:ferredoxin-NADP reductase